MKPRHIDFLRRTLTVEETIVEVSKKDSPTGQRYIIKPYPKDNEPRTIGVRQTWVDAIAAHIDTRQIGRDDLLFPTQVGTPSPGTPSAPALATRRRRLRRRLQRPRHDLRDAHASWLLAGGADLKSVMDRPKWRRVLLRVRTSWAHPWSIRCPCLHPRHPWGLARHRPAPAGVSSSLVPSARCSLMLQLLLGIPIEVRACRNCWLVLRPAR